MDIGHFLIELRAQLFFNLALHFSFVAFVVHVVFKELGEFLRRLYVFVVFPLITLVFLSVEILLSQFYKMLVLDSLGLFVNFKLHF